jgi:hypothetical protein
VAAGLGFDLSGARIALAAGFMSIELMNTCAAPTIVPSRVMRRVL